MNPTDTNILACHQHAIEAKKKANPRHLEDCSIDVETKHGTYMSYTSINIGHRAHRLFPFLECKCGAHFILMFTADKWIKMKTVPLYRKMHPVSNEYNNNNNIAFCPKRVGVG